MEGGGGRLSCTRSGTERNLEVKQRTLRYLEDFLWRSYNFEASGVTGGLEWSTAEPLDGSLENINVKAS